MRGERVVVQIYSGKMRNAILLAGGAYLGVDLRVVGHNRIFKAKGRETLEMNNRSLKHARMTRNVGKTEGR